MTSPNTQSENISTNRQCARGCCSKIDGLSVTLSGVKILHEITLHFHCGEMVAIIGPNGSGKTTLLRTMIGEIPFKGAIRYYGHGENDIRRPRIGYVPQKVIADATNPLTVRDLFQIVCSRRPIWMARDSSFNSQSSHALGHMEAEHLLDRRVGALSGGELQRVLVALALVPVPELLLLDEPIAGIDNAGMELFYKMISRIRIEHDLSIIIVAHDIALSAQYADTMVLLNKTVIVQGKPERVVNDHHTRSLMGAIYLPEHISTGPVNHHY